MHNQFDIERVFPPAFIGGKKNKNVICTTNNISKWFRYGKPKISKTFKDILKELYIPVYDKEPHSSALIVFQILRDSKRKMDPDSLSSSSYKWAIDTLVELGYIKDDDNIDILLRQTQYGNTESIETEISMKVKLGDYEIRIIDG